MEVSLLESQGPLDPTSTAPNRRLSPMSRLARCAWQKESFPSFKTNRLWATTDSGAPSAPPHSQTASIPRPEGQSPSAATGYVRPFNLNSNELKQKF